MKKEEKILYFQYLLYRLLIWQNEVVNSKENDFSVIKSLKLLFFTTAASISKGDEKSLLDIFDKFYAMPYGHIEVEVFDTIKEVYGDLEFFKFATNDVSMKYTDFSKLSFDVNVEYLNRIDNAVIKLRCMNDEMICYSKNQLIELSHQWYSWRKNYAVDKPYGKRSNIIPILDIKSESKIFNLMKF